MKKSGLSMLKKALAIGAVAFSTFAINANVSEAAFEEFPIGDQIEDPVNHFKVALVYFQPVTMDGSMGLPADQADIHIETDIAATEGNECGFGVGDWIPYLTVHYKFTKRETGESIEGTFMPMSASDGPHYGANVKMLGAGIYDCDFSIESPLRQNYMLHIDEETGVPGRFWTEPVKMSWVFDYVPRKW